MMSSPIRIISHYSISSQVLVPLVTTAFIVTHITVLHAYLPHRIVLLCSELQVGVLLAE